MIFKEMLKNYKIRKIGKILIFLFIFFLLFDLNDILVKCDSEVMLGAATDYMIDLINPEFLDFGEKK
jgi:hypothetical protein